MVEFLKLRRIKIVYNELFVEPFFCSVLILICIFTFACFIGFNNIAFGIDDKLYVYSDNNGQAIIMVSGDQESLYKFIDERKYTVYKIGCYVDFSSLGYNPDYIDKETGKHRYLSGTVERVFLGGTRTVQQMNRNIICGNSYDYSDNESYYIWLSELSANYINAKIGDTISIDTGIGRINAKVKGIYLSDSNDIDSDIPISDFYLSAAFLEYYNLFDNLEVIVPELTLNKQNEMISDFRNNGFRSTTSSTFETLLHIKMGFYLIAIFSCFITAGIMISMTKLYISRRKSFYSILRLIGINKASVMFMIFSLLQMLYSSSFALSLAFIPFIYSRLINSIELLLGTGATNSMILNSKIFICYLIVTICNAFAVLISSKDIVTNDISNSIKMGVEG